MPPDRLPATVAGLYNRANPPGSVRMTPRVAAAQPFASYEDAESFLHRATQILGASVIRGARKLRAESLESDVWDHICVQVSIASRSTAAVLLRQRLRWPMHSKRESYRAHRINALMGDMPRQETWDPAYGDLPPSVFQLLTITLARVAAADRSLYVMALLEDLLAARWLDLRGLQDFYNLDVFKGPLSFVPQVPGEDKHPELVAKRAATSLRENRITDLDLLLGLTRARCRILPDLKP